jgi:hypothetical protein
LAIRFLLIPSTLTLRRTPVNSWRRTPFAQQRMCRLRKRRR